jgi:hypothetical protein
MERLLHREGQLLSGADLRDARDADDLLRALHVRHQHGTWGIARGLEVTVATGGSRVIVGPGHAIGASGRDLLLPAKRTVAAPSAAGSLRFALVATQRWPAGDPCGCGCTEIALVDPKGRMADRLDLTWERVEGVHPDAVVLAVARIAGAHVVPPLDLRARRYTRRLWRPRMAGGTTEGRSAWRSWKEGLPTSLGIEVDVDTSDASFRETPLYFAALAGPASPTTPSIVGDPAWPFGAGSVLDGQHLGFVAAARADGFVFRLARGPAPFGFPLGASAAQEAGWHVQWVGVEAGGQP